MNKERLLIVFLGSALLCFIAFVTLGGSETDCFEMPKNFEYQMLPHIEIFNEGPFICAWKYVDETQQVFVHDSLRCVRMEPCKK